MEKLACTGQFKWEFSNLSSTGPDQSPYLDLATLSTVLINGNPWEEVLMKVLRLWSKESFCVFFLSSISLIPGLELITQNLSHVSPPPLSPLLPDAIAQQKLQGTEPWERVGGGIRGELVTSEHGPPTPSGRGWTIVSGLTLWLQGVILPSALAESEK